MPNLFFGTSLVAKADLDALLCASSLASLRNVPSVPVRPAPRSGFGADSVEDGPVSDVSGGFGITVRIVALGSGS